MDWYKKSKSNVTEATSMSPPPYGDNAAIQKQEDLVPSRILRRKKKKCKNNNCSIK